MTPVMVKGAIHHEKKCALSFRGRDFGTSLNARRQVNDLA